jgi:hypothetical protein
MGEVWEGSDLTGMMLFRQIPNSIEVGFINISKGKKNTETTDYNVP